MAAPADRRPLDAGSPMVTPTGRLTSWADPGARDRLDEATGETRHLPHAAGLLGGPAPVAA